MQVSKESLKRGTPFENKRNKKSIKKNRETW
jgi:hypothetical protein